MINIIAVVGFIALFGGGIILGLSSMTSATYDSVDVVNESHQPASLPANITVDNVFQGVSDNSEEIRFYDSSAGSETVLQEGTDYEVVSYSSGEFEIQDSTALSDYNSTDGDELRFDYTYEEGSKASDFLNKSVDAFMVVPGLLEVIVVFGFVSVLIGLLWFAMSRMGLGRATGL